MKAGKLLLLSLLALPFAFADSTRVREAQAYRAAIDLSGRPPVISPPRVLYIPGAELSKSLRCQKREACETYYGFTDPIENIIYVNTDLVDPQSNEGMATLVHEMVHVLQRIRTREDYFGRTCMEKEREAYEVENRWRTIQGMDLVDVDWFYQLTRCTQQ